jgi:hypothetical protein
VNNMMNAADALGFVTTMNRIRDQIELCNQVVDNQDNELNLNGVDPGPIMQHLVNAALVHSLQQLSAQRLTPLRLDVDRITERMSALAQLYITFQAGETSFDDVSSEKDHLNTAFDTYLETCDTLFQPNGQLIQAADQADAEVDHANADQDQIADDGGADPNNDQATG